MPVVLPSSLITKFLKTGLLRISLKPSCLSTPSLLRVLKFWSLSFRVSSFVFSSGISNMVITLCTQSKLWILYFKLNKLLTELSEVISSLGLYVRTRNSFDPYLLFTSFKYCKSGSPSMRRVSEEASSLKFLELKLKNIKKQSKIKNTSFGFSIIFFL